MTATSEALNAPCLSARDRALALMRAALREIVDEATTMGPEATAAAALRDIETLLGETP